MWLFLPGKLNIESGLRLYLAVGSDSVTSTFVDLAMTESSPTRTETQHIAVLEALIEIELRIDRIGEIVLAMSDKCRKIDNNMQILADREY